MLCARNPKVFVSLEATRLCNRSPGGAGESGGGESLEEIFVSLPSCFTRETLNTQAGMSLLSVLPLSESQFINRGINLEARCQSGAPLLQSDFSLGWLGF